MFGFIHETRGERLFPNEPDHFDDICGTSILKTFVVSAGVRVLLIRTIMILSCSTWAR